uniref:ATP-binding protein n=2 Tax=Bifidobacterium longum TaxID=216816 RepID=UPI001E516E20
TPCGKPAAYTAEKHRSQSGRQLAKTHIGRADLIILDEFGYVPFDIDGARLLYRIIAGSYERRSIIFTTNIEFSKWGTVFADDKLAAAIIDRIVHHGRLLEFTGQSRRVSEALMFGRNTSAQPEK